VSGLRSIAGAEDRRGRRDLALAAVTIVIGNVVALSSRIGGVIETAPQVAAPVARLSGEGQRG